MERIKISELGKHIGMKVVVKGWVHDLKDQSKIIFILLRDSSGIAQIVVSRDNSDFEKIAKLTRESVISLTGVVKEAKITNPEVSEKSAEVKLENFELLAAADSVLPIQVVKGKDDAELPTRLDWRCLDLRKPANKAIFKIQHALLEGMMKYLNSQGFNQVFTPCLMGVPSESGSEMFEVKYFNTTAYLRQDPQLHRQLTIASGFEKIYDIGPSWRAEQSHTTKHLCEHRTCAVEFAFIKDETDTMRVEEQLIIHAIKNVIETCPNELALLGVELKVPTAPFPELRFPEIYDILEKKGYDIRGQDLDTEAEAILWEYVKEEFGSEFYFFNRFPFKIKPFYVMQAEGTEYARSVDLNCKGLELSSGGQREHRWEKIIEQVKDKGLSEKSVEWFTQFFKYGVPPHGGFAIGIERLTKILLGVKNVKEAVLFPRDPDRLTP